MGTKEKIDPRKILRGYDGLLYHDGNLLAEVNEFSASITITNTDYQPAGSKLVVGVTTGYSVGLTFTETVIKDARLLKRLLDHIKGDEEIDFDFLGELEGHDGTTGRYAFRACEPDGSIDIVNVSPGDIIRRSWGWRVNEPPDLQDVLGGEAA